WWMKTHASGWTGRRGRFDSSSSWAARRTGPCFQPGYGRVKRGLPSWRGFVGRNHITIRAMQPIRCPTPRNEEAGAIRKFGRRIGGQKARRILSKHPRVWPAFKSHGGEFARTGSAPVNQYSDRRLALNGFTGGGFLMLERPPLQVPRRFRSTAGSLPEAIGRLSKQGFNAVDHGIHTAAVVESQIDNVAADMVIREGSQGAPGGARVSKTIRGRPLNTLQRHQPDSAF